MRVKAVSGIMLTLLFTSMLTLAFNIQPVRASATIYIRADGSVDPPTANITNVDNVTYHFTGNIYDKIVVERSNIVVDGNGYTLQGLGSGNGFNLTGINNVTVKNMEIKGFEYGILIHSSSNNVISGNNVTENGGIYFGCGIYLGWSSSNTVSGNTITNNEYCGVHLLVSHNNTISGNNITNSNGGVWLWDSSNNSISGNNITNNEYYAILLRESSNHNSISGNHITENLGEGIYLYMSSNNSISGNNITNSNDQGIELYESSDNSISGNSITNNSFGIVLGSSSNNSIYGNNVTNNNGDGINLQDSSNYNSIYGNSITNNNVTGIMLDYSSSNSIYGNNITNNTIGVLFSLSFNNTVSGNNITNNVWGIEPYFSSNNSIYGNNITNNECGIVLAESSDNSISGNNITNSNYGVYLYSSSNNTFYHNNFIDNTKHVNTSNSVNFWDDGYPSGGNYWSNYVGVDFHSGPYQNITGSDGIGDTPYPIDENNQDRYPIMKPYFAIHDIAVANITPFKTVVGQGYSVSINVTVENQGNYTETFNVTTYYNGTIPNGDFEKDPAGTSYNDITDWNYSLIVHKGNPPTGENLQIVDDYYFRGDKSLYSYLKTTSVPPFPGDSRLSQYFSAEKPVSTTADYITLWIGGDGYTTSSRYYWHVQLILTDGTNTYSEILRADRWDGMHYNYYNATETGVDGNAWKRYTRRIPDSLNKSNLTVNVGHYQGSWDLTTASSWYRLDNIYFSDSEGNPRADIETKTVTNLPPGEETTITLTWNTTGVPYGNYTITAFAHPVPNETDTIDNTYIDSVVRIVPIYTLTITTTTGGTTDPSPGSYTHAAGSSVEVTAIPDTYYVLDYWELDGFNVGSANPYSVLMDDNHTLHAVFAMHDVAVTNVVQWFKDPPIRVIDGAYHTWPINLNVTVENVGDLTVNCTVTVYYDSIPIATQNATDLVATEIRTLTLTGDITGLDPGKNPGVSYTLKANATTIGFPDINPANNEYAYGQVKVRRWGDVDNSDTITILDLKKVKLDYSNIIVEPFADLDGNCNVNILDVKLIKLIYSGIL